MNLNLYYIELQKFMYEPSYRDLSAVYAYYFTLGNLNTDIGSKFALISLICYLTFRVRKKNPKATCLQVINKITEKDKAKHDEKFIQGLSIICEDFMRNTSEFLTFELKTQKEIISKIKEIMNTWLPF